MVDGLRIMSDKPKFPRAAALLPCPFCGSPADGPLDVSVPHDAQNWWQIMCADENRAGCNAWRSAGTPEEVAEKWNSRAMPEVAAVMEIVEGCLGQQWSANGRRLVDTPEWCALYVAWRRATKS